MGCKSAQPQVLGVCGGCFSRHRCVVHIVRKSQLQLKVPFFSLVTPSRIPAAQLKSNKNVCRAMPKTPEMCPGAIVRIHSLTGAASKHNGKHGLEKYLHTRLQIAQDGLPISLDGLFGWMAVWSVANHSGSSCTKIDSFAGTLQTFVFQAS